AAAATAVATTRTATAAATGATHAAAAGTRTVLRLVDAQGATTHVETVQRTHRALGISLGHLDESEAARPAGLAVCREGNGLDGAVLAEQFTHVVRRGEKRQLAHVDLGHSNILRSNTSIRSSGVIARPAPNTHQHTNRRSRSRNSHVSQAQGQR